MANVRPREGGPYSLYCYDCQRWIPNTANYEMQKEGIFAHGHMCYEDKSGKRIILTEPGIKDEKEGEASGRTGESEQSRPLVGEQKAESGTSESGRDG